MNNKSVSISVLQRFMSPGELTDFMEKYKQNKGKAHSLKYIPNQVDIDLFNRNPKPTIEEFMAHFNLKTKEGVLRKIGLTYLAIK